MSVKSHYIIGFHWIESIGSIICTMNHDGAMQLLSEHFDKVDWNWLSRNPHPTALKYLRENPGMIDVERQSQNKNPAALEILEQHIHKLQN